MTKIKDELIRKHQESPVEIGCKIYVARSLFDPFHKGKGTISAVVCGIDKSKGLYQVHRAESCFRGYKIWLRRDQFTKCIYTIGADPFPSSGWRNGITKVNYSLESILYQCGISAYGREEHYTIAGLEVPEMNFNPYVTDQNGHKHYFQRELCWTLEDERSFIESIYHDIDCGTIIVRKYAWGDLERKIKQGETEIAFKDIIDGKQRINTLARFVTDQFTDIHGNYFSDLSAQAQRKFENSQALGFAQMNEDTTDRDVLESFLLVNFAGRPMSKEHINYVTQIAKLFVNNDKE